MLRSNLLSWVSVAVLATTVAGCSDQSNAPDLINLTQPLRMVSTAPNAASRVEFTASGALSRTPAPLALALKGLEIEVQTGSRPELRKLSLPLGDVSLSPMTLPPDGLQLRDLA